MLLKQLGLKDDFLAQRVVCLWPAVLARDVEQQLRPIVTFLMSTGLEVRLTMWRGRPPRRR